MKIGILGDIHGNIEAFRSAYDALLSNDVKKVYHLGDLGGYAPFVNEVVKFLIEHQIEGVQGNYDEAVANDREHCRCRYEDSVQAEMAHLSFEWTRRHVTEKSKDCMKNLPFEIAFFIYGKRVKIFHATPIENNIYWYEDRDEAFFLNMARKAGADVMIYGHTHISYRKNLNSNVFINAGSVGRPKDGDARTCFCIVDITHAEVKTDFLRIPYDVEKVASAIIKSGLLAYFAERLRIGK